MSHTATYAYRAARQDGTLEFGSVEAGSRETVSALLAARGLFPLEIRVDVRAETGRGLSLADLALGLHILATLLESGLPLSRALQALSELTPASWRRALPSMQQAVREGQSLASAMRASPVAFPPLVSGIIQAGEAGGRVAEAVKRAAEIVEGQHATRAALHSALAYPLILATAGTASLALLVGVILPRFASILADLGQATPPTTRLVLDGAELLVAAALPSVLMLGVLTLLVRAWLATPVGRERWHALLLAVPLIGPVRRSLATFRTGAALAALLESGMPIATALRHAAPAAGDVAISARLIAARETILRGQRVAQALGDEDALTPTAVLLLRTGEETGRLAEFLARAARLEGEMAARKVRTATKLLEPLLILVFGGLVAVVAASLLQAVYALRPGL
jgi:general secretion pathway protein F